MTPTIELLRSHRSIRHFTDAPMPEKDILPLTSADADAAKAAFRLGGTKTNI